MNNKGGRYIGKYISQIQRKGASYITRELSNVGIGHGQLMFLMELYKSDGIKQEELSDKLNIDKGTTARAIKKLEDSGLVNRITDENDKRAYKIYVTKSGKGIKQDILDVIYRWEEKVTVGLNDSEKVKLVELLEKICENQDIR